MIEEALTYSEKGLYFNDGQDLFFLANGDKKCKFLEHLTYKDDMSTETRNFGNFKSYIERPVAGDITLAYGEKLYYTSLYEDIQGNKKIRVNTLDQIGKNKQKLLEISFEPYNLLINEGKILMCEFAKNDKCKIHLYDQNLKEKIIEMPYTVSSLYSGDSCFFFVADEMKDGIYKEYLYKIDYEGNTTLIEQINGNIVFVGDNSYILLEFINGDEKNTKSILKNMKGEILKEEIERNIMFVDDNYYYTEAKGSKQAYGRYTLDGKLDKELIPQDQLGKMGQAVFSKEKDYESIERVIGDEFLVRQLDRTKGFLIYIMGSFKTGKFRIIDSSALELKYE